MSKYIEHKELLAWITQARKRNMTAEAILHSIEDLELTETLGDSNSKGLLVEGFLIRRQTPLEQEPTPQEQIAQALREREANRRRRVKLYIIKRQLRKQA